MLVIEVWPGKAPDDHGEIGAELFHSPPPGSPADSTWLTNVTCPSLTVYRPMTASPNHKGTAVIVCPGGGYSSLGWNLEGTEIAEWFSTIGVTGIVLKYRVPRRPGQPVEQPPPGPLQDAQRAVSLVRSKAAEWNLDSNRIGIMGFSAGAHLALAAATGFEQRTYASLDTIDKESCRPDFAISLYAGYLVKRGQTILAPWIRIPAKTPPIFMVHAHDDNQAPVEESVMMYLALKQAGVSAELHVYATGKHGFGIRNYNQPISSWPERCADWLHAQGLLDRDTATQR